VAVPTLHHPTTVSAGAEVCAIDDDGIHCWGTIFDQNAAPPPTLSHPTQVSSGLPNQQQATTCALDDQGVTCWTHQAGGATTMMAVPTLHHPTQVSAGAAHACAVDDDGVHCWGDNSSGQTTVPTLSHPRQVSAAVTHTCALDDAGVHCWGDDSSGQTDVPPLRHPTQVGTGELHTCAVDADTIVCWGDDLNQESDVPPGLELVGPHACLPANGRPRCVGHNEHGQLGVGTYQDLAVAIVQASPTDLGQGFTSVASTAVGHGFGCALNPAGAVKCWGRNVSGQLGLGDTRSRGAGAGEMGDALPQLVFAGSQAAMTELDVGTDHACALGGQSEVFCWGSGGSGQLGTEDKQDVGTASGPVRAHVKGGLVVRDLALGAEHSCLLTTEGSVYCFGLNDVGQLGVAHTGNIGDAPGTMGASMQPVNLGAGFSVKSLASGDSHVCALSQQGTVKCWGANDLGQLGLGDTTNRGSSATDLGDALPAVDLGHGQVAVDLDCGKSHCCVRTIQNTMKCWGDNTSGQLGLGDQTARGSGPGAMGDDLPFVMMAPDERIISIRVDADRTCARTDAGLRCWGRNSGGELGYGDQTPRGGAPTTIPRLLPTLGI
jgi:alpha-tubulin suppressor-like RCC1 family protein